MTETAPQNAAVRLGELVFVAAQLVLAFGVAKLFAIEEERGLFENVFWEVDLIWLIAGAFVVHAVLPLRWRLPFFVLCSISLVFVVIGPTRSLWLLLIGLGLIGLCHVPLPFRVRVGIILVVAAFLVALQARWIDASSKITEILPVLGSIFMFRLAVYLYDIRHEKGPVSPWQRISYFFLLPNPLFPLFPVVDYKTFLRTYYSEPAGKVYQKGVLWIGRGITHLVLYRLVYGYLTPDVSEVTGFRTLLLFVVSSYLLYLRISGQFHLIVGVLSLFGFNLPETHRFYLLASGFNDYWRRINIYWKDFMMKLVYYPVFAQTRKFGMLGRLTIATAAVFTATWLLHAYQFFWLRGSFHITATDTLFWGLFGLLVIVNSLHEATRKPGTKARVGTAKTWTGAGAAVKRSCQVAAMFVLMCFLWSLWGSQSLTSWWGALSQARHVTAPEFLWTVAIVAGAIGVGAFGQYLKTRGFDLVPDRPGSIRMAWSGSIPMVVLLGIGLYHDRVGLVDKPGEIADAMRGEAVRAQDQIDLERGYYENLLSKKSTFAKLLRKDPGIVGGRPGDRGEEFPENREKWLFTDDLRSQIYQPSAEGVTVGIPWSTNRWGLRDKEYSKEKPEGVYRIAVLGTSYTMGRGVPDGRNFESVLEGMLNEHEVGPGETVEILNFATSGYSTLEYVFVCDHVIPEFDADAVFLVAHGKEEPRASNRLVAKVMAKSELSYPYLKDVRRRARLQARESEDENLRRVKPFGEEVLQWCYQKLVDSCRAHGMEAVWIFLPTTMRINRAQDDIAELRPLAESAGFKCVTVPRPFGDMTPEEIRIHPKDKHPNERAHGVFARRLFDVLKKDGPKLSLGLDFGDE